MASDHYRRIYAFPFSVSIIYWGIEACFEYINAPQQSYLVHFFSPAPHELWMRLISVAFFFGSAFFIQVLKHKAAKAGQDHLFAHREMEQIFQTAADGMRIIDVNFDTRRVNKAFLELTGLSEQETVGKKCHEIFRGIHCGTPLCPLVMIQAGSGAIQHETEKIKKDGSRRTCVVRATALHDEHGALVGIIEDFQDITEFREREHFLREIYDNMSSGVVVYTVIGAGADFVFKDMNMGGLKICAQPDKSAIIGKSVRAVFPGVQEMGLLDVFKRVWQTGSAEHFALQNYRDDRLQLWVENYVFRLRSGEIVAVFDDVTEQKRQQDVSFQNEKKYRIFLESTSAVPWELDLRNGDFTYMGKQIEKILGYDAATWKDVNSWAGRLHPDDREEAVMFCECETRKGKDHDFAYRAIHADGSTRWIRDIVSVIMGVDGRPEKLIGFMQDITVPKENEQERRMLEQRLTQAQKMEAIGTLAGGIAHDFNNILGVILGYADMVREQVAPGSQAASDLENVLAAGDRAKNLVRQILAFSRQTNVDRITMQPASIVKEALKLLRSSIPTTIDIQQSIDPGCGLIDADPTQVQQILLNLCANAFHAMEESGGVLSVSLRNVFLDEGEGLVEPGVQPGQFVQLTVRDTGKGIAAEILGRIFEPYFTTKPAGKGTGLGLAIVHGIAKSYGGFVTCESVPGQGTSFHVFFPAAQAEAALRPEEAKKQAGQTHSGGNEHILFVDDEVLLVELSKTMLGNLGYRVTVMNSGVEALEVFSRDPGKFDLIITDQTMHGLTGVNLAREVLKIRPEMPIILCTGYSSAISREEAEAIGIRKFLYKPLVKEDIAVSIREALKEKIAVAHAV